MIPFTPKFLIPATQHDLDQDPLLRGRLICLTRVDGHAKWVSRRVLELMGELPAEVEGGYIVRDTQGGPIGTYNISSYLKVLTNEQGVFVDNAMELIPIPERTEDVTAKFFDIAMKDALSVGLTSIHDADSLPEEIRFFKK